MFSITDGCEGPMPSVNRPPATACTDSASCAIVIGWRGYVGTTAVPSSIRSVTDAASVIAVNASRLHGMWGTQPVAKPAASAARAFVWSCSTEVRSPDASPMKRPIRMTGTLAGSVVAVRRRLQVVDHAQHEPAERLDVVRRPVDERVLQVLRPSLVQPLRDLEPFGGRVDEHHPAVTVTTGHEPALLEGADLSAHRGGV